MDINKKINEKYNFNYFKIDENDNEIQITSSEYNVLSYIKRGGEAISLENLEIKTFIRSLIFKHEFIYDFLLPIIHEFNINIMDIIKKSDNINYNNLKLYITGGTSLIINLDKYTFSENENELYNKLFEKSDIDAYIVVNVETENDKLYKNIIRIITRNLLYKYKEIVLNNTMFMRYICEYIIEYTNNHEKYLGENDIKKIKKTKSTNKNKYEDKDYISKQKYMDKKYEDLFIRINEGIHFNENELKSDLYRLMTSYEVILKDNRILNLWVELIDITIKEIYITVDDVEQSKQVHEIVKKVINIIYENIKQKKATIIDDIPKTNRNYNITNIMWYLSNNNDEFVRNEKYNNVDINVLTLKGYIYESVLIIMNTPDDPKIQKRINRLHFIISLLKKNENII